MSSIAARAKPQPASARKAAPSRTASPAGSSKPASARAPAKAAKGSQAAKARGGLLARLSAWWQRQLRRPGSDASSLMSLSSVQPSVSDAGPSTQPAEFAEPSRQDPWLDAQHALSVVLSRHASARQVFRHLGVLEKALARQGGKALAKLPTEVLEPALAQLEDLVNDWSQAPLAFLRSSLSVEIGHRKKLGAAKDQGLSVFVAPNKLEVADEDSESAFMEFQRHWAAANADAALPPRNRRAA